MKGSKVRAWLHALEQAFPPPKGQAHGLQHEEFWDNAAGFRIRIRVTLTLHDREETVFLYGPDVSLPVHRVVALVREVVEVQESWATA